MKVILNRDVPNLGEEGDICDVAPGYARNYLLPQGMVLQHNARNLALIGERREQIEQRKEDKRREAMGLKERLEAQPIVVKMRAGANGRLFGSVTNATIAEHLAKDGIEVERKKIEIPDNTIKSLGNYKVMVRLYADEEAEVKISVEPTADSEVVSRKREASNARSADAEAADDTEAREAAELTADTETPAAAETPETAKVPMDSEESVTDSEAPEVGDTAEVAENPGVEKESADTEEPETERNPSAE